MKGNAQARILKVFVKCQTLACLKSKLFGWQGYEIYTVDHKKGGKARDAFFASWLV